MTRHIVVPLNHTARAERALPIAARLARALDAPLLLVSVRVWPMGDQAGEAERHAELLGDYPDLDGESVVVRSGGSTAMAIAAQCGPEDVICMGADHVRSVSEVLIGSVFIELVRAFRGPVVAVGPHATVPGGADRLLLCMDALEHSRHALQLVPSFADPLGLRPFLIEAIEPSQDRAALRGHPILAAGEGTDVVDTSELRAIAATLLDRNGTARTDIGWDVVHGEASRAIGALSQEGDVAFIGLATDAVDPITRILSPSLANDLLRTSYRPLVLVSGIPEVINRQLLPRAIPEP